MRIALDATYSLGDALSGVGVYSREILNGLAASGFAEEWDWFYRSRRYWRARMQVRPRNVRVRLLLERRGDRKADLFHGLNQRLPELRFRRQVATFHDLFVLSGEYSSKEFRERFAAQARAAAAGADLIIAVSAFTASQVEYYLNVPIARVRVIHHGVLPRPAGEVPREKVILCVGAIQKRKNQIALVQAFRAAPPDWTLVLAGSQGYEAEPVLREVSNSPAAARRILLTGYISDAEMANWYARASIFAFPSLDEGFGMPVLEAMAAGIPVIAGNGSSLPEICGDAAMLVNPRDAGELANAIEILARDEGLRAKMAAIGRQHAGGFRWEDAVQNTVAVYRELI